MTEVGDNLHQLSQPEELVVFTWVIVDSFSFQQPPCCLSHPGTESLYHLGKVISIFQIAVL